MKQAKAIGLFLYCIGSTLFMAGLPGLFSGDATGFLTEDSVTYLSLATHGAMDAYRTVLYPAFLHMLNMIFPSGFFLQGVFLTQLLLWTVTAWISMLLMQRYLPLQVVMIIGAALLFNPSFVIYTHLVLTEILFLFLLICATFFLLREPVATSYHQYAGYFLLCLLPLLRPGFLVFVVLFSIYQAFILAGKKEWKRLLLVALLFGMTIGYPVIRFQQVYHRYTLSFIGDETLYRYLTARTMSIVKQTGIDDEMALNDRLAARHHNKPAWQQAALQREEAIRTIRRYPLQSTQAYVLSLVSNTHTGNNYLHYIRPNAASAEKKIFETSRVMNMVLTFLLLPAILATGWIWITGSPVKRHAFFPHLCFLAAVSAFLFFSSGISFWQGDRFHITWMPLCGMIYAIFLHIGLNRKDTGQRNGGRFGIRPVVSDAE